MLLEKRPRCWPDIQKVPAVTGAFGNQARAERGPALVPLMLLVGVLSGPVFVFVLAQLPSYWAP